MQHCVLQPAVVLTAVCTHRLTAPFLLLAHLKRSSARLQRLQAEARLPAAAAADSVGSKAKLAAMNGVGPSGLASGGLSPEDEAAVLAMQCEEERAAAGKDRCCSSANAAAASDGAGCSMAGKGHSANGFHAHASQPHFLWCLLGAF